jgi:hypothetical protein
MTSEVQAAIGVVNIVLNAKRKDGHDLDIGELVYVWQILDRAERTLINFEWPLGLQYLGTVLKDLAGGGR